MLLDDYLDYLHESKWKKLLATGELRTKDLRRIQKAKLPKSKKQWLAGVEKGTKQKLKKVGGKVKHRDEKGRVKLDDAYSTGHDKTIYTPGNLPKKKRVVGALTKRHEADELTIGAAQRKRLKTNPGYYSRTGEHKSDEVLRRERQLGKTYKKLYGKSDKTFKKDLKDRIDYGEYSFGSKKQIRKHDKKQDKRVLRTRKQAAKIVKGWKR